TWWAGMTVLTLFVIGIPVVAMSKWRLAGERGAMASYTLEMTGDELHRHQEGLAPMIVRRSEVVRIRDAGLCTIVCTGTRGKQLYIPRTLEGYEEVRAHLRE